VVPDVPGPRILQLQYPKHYKTNRTIHVRSAPDDDEPWIGIETYPAPATAGDTVTIQTRGIGDGQVIWYQVFDPDWENVISESVPVVNNNIELTVPDAVGPRIVQLQYGNRYKTHRALTITQADQPSGGSTGSGPVIGGEQGPPLEMAGPINITTHGTRVENVKIVLPHDARRFAPAVRIAADNVTLRNVEIVGPDNGRGWGVVFSPNAKRARLTEVLVRGFHDGVLLRGEGHRFERCVFTGMHQHDSGQTPATLVGTDARDVRFEHCVFHGLTANDHHADQARHVVLSKPWKAKADSDTQQHGHALGVRFEKCVVADGPSGAFAMGTGGSFTDGIIGPFNAPSFIAPPGGAVSGNFVFFDVNAEIGDDGDWFDWHGGIGDSLGSTLFDWQEREWEDADRRPADQWRPGWVANLISIDRALLDAAIETLYANLEQNISTPIDPTPTPPNIGGPGLEPGDGFEGPTQVGGKGFQAIARWDVVPEQAFTDDLEIGVVAYHIDGIDRVEFSVEGGPWQSVTEPSLNPRTQVKEYWVRLSAGDFRDGPVEIRAVAYPKDGKPRVLEPMTLLANAGGSQNMPVVTLGAGEHRVSDLVRDLPKSGWLTIRPKPGVGRDQCVLVGGGVWGGGRLRVQGVTWRPGPGGNMAVGQNHADDWVWLDGVKVVGHGQANTTWWTTHLWGRTFVTDSHITRVQTAFHGSAGLLLARNVQITDIYEDTFRTMGLVVNVKIENVDRGPTNRHPDVFDFATGWTQHNVIFANIVGRQVKSQGFAGGNMDGVAMVDIDLHTPGWSAMQVGRTMKNVLIQNTKLIGGARFRNLNSDSRGIVLRDVKLGWQEPFLPEGWRHKSIKVVE